jgi:hypothetical protein
MNFPSVNEINAVVEANLRKERHIPRPSPENTQEFAGTLSPADVSRFNAIVEHATGLPLTSRRRVLVENENESGILGNAAKAIVSIAKKKWNLGQGGHWEAHVKGSVLALQGYTTASPRKVFYGQVFLTPNAEGKFTAGDHEFGLATDDARPIVDEIVAELNKMTPEQMASVKEDVVVEGGSLTTKYNEMVKQQEAMKKDGKEATPEYQALMASMADVNKQRMAQATESKALVVGSKVVLPSGEKATIKRLVEGGKADLVLSSGMLVESSPLGLLKPHGNQKPVGSADSDETKKAKEAKALLKKQMMEDNKSSSKLGELMTSATKTYKAGTFYFPSWQDAPKDVVEALKKAEVEVEESSYTVHEPSAFLRTSMSFADGGEADFEVSFGSLQSFADEWDEENPDGDDDDKEAHLQGVAEELASSFGTNESGASIYFHVTENPGVAEGGSTEVIDEDDERDTPADEKKYILGQIKSARELAVGARKRGNMQHAIRWENAIEGFIADAEKLGFGEEAEDYDQEVMEKADLGEAKDDDDTSPEGVKKFILKEIERVRKRAVSERKSGNIQKALRFEDEIEGYLEKAEKLGFGEEAEDADQKAMEKADLGEAKGDKAAKPAMYGFDLTQFEDAATFKKVLEKAGLPLTAKKDKDGYFLWKADGLELVTGNNPITGEYANSPERPKEEGYASYMGIEGEPAKVKVLVKAIKDHGDSKDESPGERAFI